MAKKIITFLLVVTLTASVAIGGTLAYLTDRDSEANVFTVGNVSIDLKEDFQHGAELIPGVNIEKKPTVTNTGVNDAWVWVEIAIPSELNSTASASKNILHFNMSAASVADGLWNWWDGADYSEGDYFIETREINDAQYDVYVVQYETPLKPGETTAEPVMYKVYLDARVDIDPEGNWHFVENGVATDINWNSETNGNPVIYVSAYAMQKDGFETVNEAYSAYQEQWGNNGSEYAKPIDADATPVKTAEELVAAAKNGGKVALVDDIVFSSKDQFYYGNYACCVMNDMELDLNGHSITIDTEYEGGVGNAAVLFYVYKEGASLTVVGDGNVIAKHDAFLFFPRGVSEGLYIYGGNYYNNDDSSGKQSDINAIVYSQTNNNIHIYGGVFNFKNVSGHCGGFNVYDNSGAEIVLYEGVLLSNSNYYKGSDADEIHLAEGCTLQEVTVDGETWYKVVKQ